jgi:hypothetical protein
MFGGQCGILKGWGMFNTRKYISYALFVLLGLAPALNSAHAGCYNLRGVWMFFALEITPRTDAYSGTAIECTMTIAASGAVNAPCTGWGQNGKEMANIIGTVHEANCVLSGTLSVSGKPLIIRRGYLTGSVGMGIATQVSTFGVDAMHFTLAKKI